MSVAYYAKENVLKEETMMPSFTGTALDGTPIFLGEKQDRYFVIKCWFINCATCIAEFPFLNKMVEKLKENKNLVFISMAFESAPELKTFLSKRKLKYSVLPDMKNYLTKSLKISAYPTHLIVKNGKILKVFSTAEGLQKYLLKSF